ncbi:MAG: polyhydroxyalkanoate synthesis regulator DNA-binding domain-containing protein [Minicystis sp.]
MTLLRCNTEAGVIIKKYSNRRLYDTEASQYITLEELADRIRRGAEVRVVDAKTNEDLTQSTLAQIILESRGAARLLPVPLLTQLIRMGDDALAEFFGRYLSVALDLYFQAKQGAQAIAPYNPLANVPFAATNALARLLLGAASLGGLVEQPAPPPVPAPAPPPSPPPAKPAASSSDVEALRKELEELKRSLKRSRK